MIRVGLAGLGKMGISHLAVLNAHPSIEVAAICDGLKYLTSNLAKFTGIACYDSFDDMLAQGSFDAILIATPSKTHADMAQKAIDKGLHVFCEKPFVLDPVAGEAIVAAAEAANLVTQVGYHNRFVGAFQHAAHVAKSGALGDIHHFKTEAYGPVVIRPQSATWRSRKNEGGGVVYDYACHAIDLVNFVLGPVANVSGVIRNSIFSQHVDDEVYCTMNLTNGVSGQLAANWSDASLRKMITKLSIWGTNGHLSVDRQECSTFLREPYEADFRKGWSTTNTTELTKEVWYYLRGEEYSAQIDEFAARIKSPGGSVACDFRTALETDRTVAMINGTSIDTAGMQATPDKPTRLSIFQRLKMIAGVSNG